MKKGLRLQHLPSHRSPQSVIKIVRNIDLRKKGLRHMHLVLVDHNRPILANVRNRDLMNKGLRLWVSSGTRKDLVSVRNIDLMKKGLFLETESKIVRSTLEKLRAHRAGKMEI